MSAPSNGRNVPDSVLLERLRKLNQSTYKNDLNSAFSNLYAAQNYGSDNQITAVEAGIDRNFKLPVKLFNPETIEEFRDNLEPTIPARLVGLAKKPPLPPTAAQPSALETKTLEVLERIEQKLENDENERKGGIPFSPRSLPPLSLGTREPTSISLAPTILAPTPKASGKEEAKETTFLPKPITPKHSTPTRPSVFTVPSSSSVSAEHGYANGIPQFKYINDAGVSDVISVLGTYYGYDVENLKNKNARELKDTLKNEQAQVKANATSYPIVSNLLTLKGFQPTPRTGKGLGSMILGSIRNKTPLVGSKTNLLDTLRKRANGGKLFSPEVFRNYRPVGGPGTYPSEALRNQRAITAGEIAAGNDNPMLRSLSGRLKRIPIY